MSEGEAENAIPNQDKVPGAAYYRHLSTSVMFNTRGARFAASQLLVMKERASLFILSTLTIVLIGISVFLLGIPEAADVQTTRQVGILSAVASVAILAITLFDYAMGRGLLAAKLHENSLQITRIMRLVERELERPVPSLENLEKYASEYEELNIATGVNHSSIDFMLFKMSRRSSECWAENFVWRVYSFVAHTFVITFAVLPGLVTLIGVLIYARGLLKL